MKRISYDDVDDKSILGYISKIDRKQVSGGKGLIATIVDREQLIASPHKKWSGAATILTILLIVNIIPELWIPL